MKLALQVVALLLVAAPLSVNGHSDDAGDIYPQVRVEDGKFAIYFKNNLEEKTFRTLLDKNGTILSKRKESPAPPEIALPVEVEEVEHGIVVPFGSVFYVFPKWLRLHHGKPYMVKVVEGQKQKVPLKWGRTEVEEVHEVTVISDWILLTTSPRESRNPANWVFTFHAFNRQTQEMQSSAGIGVPTRIYSFPQDSNIEVSGEYAYVAWMGGTDETRLHLSRFHPQTGKIETRNISRGHWNSSASIGIIGDNLLIAFHRPRTDNANAPGRGRAEIGFEMVSLREAFK